MSSSSPPARPTSPVAEEAALTAAWAAPSSASSTWAWRASTACWRTGTARGAAVLVVVAGMEGALASVVGGLVRRPVIAVPTSVGYGATFGGLAALLGHAELAAPRRHGGEHRQRLRRRLRVVLIDGRDERVRRGVMNLRGLHLHLDCFAGIAGDMTLARCSILGVPEAVVREAIVGLGLPATAPRVSNVRRGGLAGKKVDVRHRGHDRRGRAWARVQPSGHEPHHEHEHDHHHDHRSRSRRASSEESARSSSRVARRRSRASRWLLRRAGGGRSPQARRARR